MTAASGPTAGEASVGPPRSAVVASGTDPGAGVPTPGGAGGADSPGGAPAGGATGDVVSSEFAQVRVSIDHDANGPRLRLDDLKSERSRHLDALELETLVWLPERSLQQLLDPGLRWRESS